MSKSAVLQTIAGFILVLGSYILYELITDPSQDKSLILGIGPIICGLALIIISKSKSFKG